MSSQTIKRRVNPCAPLTLFSGDSRDVRYALWGECLLEHIHGNKDARTVFIERGTSPNDARSRIEAACLRGTIVGVFELLEDSEQCDIALDLISKGSRVWAGVASVKKADVINQFLSLTNRQDQEADIDVVWMDFSNQSITDDDAPSRMEYLEASAIALNTQIC
jgi:hypothetical protein